MPSVGASVNGISDSLVFLRLVVEVVKEVEELLARVDGGVMAQKREVRVVLRVVDLSERPPRDIGKHINVWRCAAGMGSEFQTGIRHA